MSARFRGGATKEGRTYERTAQEMLLDLLETRNLSLMQCARLCQRDRDTVRRAMAKLKAKKLVHIAEWNIPYVGPHEAVWAIGDDVDAQNPPRLTRKELTRRWRARKHPPSVIRIDPLLAAMMGVTRHSKQPDSFRRQP